MQCHSPNGIPFYINLPEVIIARCLSNPHTASLIKRYPVLKEDDEPIGYANIVISRMTCVSVR